jgi:hypothetical protein
MCRPTTRFAGIFPLIYFANEWLNAPGVPSYAALELRPLVKLALGVAPFVILWPPRSIRALWQPVRDRLHVQRAVPQIHLASSWPYGIASIIYIPLHVQAFFEQMPNVADHAAVHLALVVGAGDVGHDTGHPAHPVHPPEEALPHAVRCSWLACSPRAAS